MKKYSKAELIVETALQIAIYGSMLHETSVQKAEKVVQKLINNGHLKEEDGGKTLVAE